MIAQIPFDETKYKAAIGVDELFGEKGYSTLERNSCRPSFDICGIWGGYTEEGSKTVLPSKAYAKVSAAWFRIRIMRRFQNCLKSTSFVWLRLMSR